MHSLTDIIVATERERQIRHATADVSPFKVLPYPMGGTDEVYSIVIVLRNTGSYRKNVRIEYYIVRLHANLFGQNVVSPLCNFYLPFVSRSLSLLVEAHNNHCCPITHNVTGMALELFLAILQGNRVDDALALNAFQSCNDNIPFRRINHYRHTGNLRLTRNHIEEVHHLRFGIKQSVVHVDINDKSPVVDLLTGNRQSFVIFLLIYKSKELPAASHIAPFANIIKCCDLARFGINDLVDIESGKKQMVIRLCNDMGLLAFCQWNILCDKLIVGATTSADNVDKSLINELANLRSH